MRFIIRLLSHSKRVVLRAECGASHTTANRNFPTARQPVAARVITSPKRRPLDKVSVAVVISNVMHTPFGRDFSSATREVFAGFRKTENRVCAVGQNTLRAGRTDRSEGWPHVRRTMTIPRTRLAKSPANKCSTDVVFVRSQTYRHTPGNRSRTLVWVLEYSVCSTRLSRKKTTRLAQSQTLRWRGERPDFDVGPTVAESSVDRK